MPRPARRAFARLAAAALALALAAATPLTGAVPPASAANGEPYAASQWGLRQVGADVAWDVTKGRGARVGIVDTGIDLGHAELAGQVVASTRCIGTGGVAARCGGEAQDDSGHGTHVAGIVAARIDGAGVAGVAPEASLLVVKALRADGSGEAPDVAAGIDWLVGQGVNVVNLSLAETLSPRRVQGSPLEVAIRRAADAGVVVVLAAGNHGEAADGTTAFNLPAIVVGATDRSGRLARYSRPLDTGIRWGMAAPGGDGSGGTEGEVVSTYWFAGRHNAYAWSEGTSMAAPHVAGAAALLATQGIKGQAAVERLLGTAAPADCGTGCRGVLDVRTAVGAAAPAAAQAASNPASRATPATAPPEPPPATPTTSPTTGPAVADPTPTPVGAGSTDGVPDPTAEVAGAPVDRAPALAAPRPARRQGLVPEVAVVAGIALLVVAAATAACSVRRLRADEGW